MHTENSSVSNQNRNNKICGLCNSTESKYCCPRCDVLYCSIDCYKSEKHAECSESFYRDCVHEELSTYHADDESKNKMIDILKKLHNEEINDNGDVEELIGNDDQSIDSDDIDETDLHERVKDLDLNDADVIWNALTQDEKNEFEALLNKGDVGCIMPQWEPWWLYRREKKLVEDVDKRSDELSKCPHLKEVPKFNVLTTVKPSNIIQFNITNVLASYVFIMRYFNGEVEPKEGVTCLLGICANLDTNTNFDDLATAVESVAQKCLQSDLIQTDEVSLQVMKHDTFLVLKGPSDNNKKYYSKAALSHIHEMLTEAKSVEKTKSPKMCKKKEEFSKKFPDHGMEQLPKIDVTKVKKCAKKIEYYLSYIESYDMNFE